MSFAFKGISLIFIYFFSADMCYTYRSWTASRLRDVRSILPPYAFMAPERSRQDASFAQ